VEFPRRLELSLIPAFKMAGAKTAVTEVAGKLIFAMKAASDVGLR